MHRHKLFQTNQTELRKKHILWVVDRRLTTDNSQQTQHYGISSSRPKGRMSLKSDMNPEQQKIFLGIILDQVRYQARLSQDRIERCPDILQMFLRKPL